MTPDERQLLDGMDAAHEEWLMDKPRRLREAEAREAQGELGGRESGPEEWRAARDELGDGAVSSIEAGPPRPKFKGELVSKIAFDRSLSLQPYIAPMFDIKVQLRDPDNITDDTVVNSPFNLSNDVYLLGNAERIGGVVRLTNGPSQTSSVFSDFFISRSQSVRVIMRFRMGGEGDGADGMALVFVSQRGVGVGGYGLGYEGLGGEGDFAVEGG